MSRCISSDSDGYIEPADVCPTCGFSGVYRLDTYTYTCDNCNVIWLANETVGANLCRMNGLITQYQ
jgi:ribosomal protein L37AE/L43A